MPGAELSVIDNNRVIKELDSSFDVITIPPSQQFCIITSSRVSPTAELGVVVIFRSFYVTKLDPKEEHASVITNCSTKYLLYYRHLSTKRYKYIKANS